MTDIHGKSNSNRKKFEKKTNSIGIFKNLDKKSPHFNLTD